MAREILSVPESMLPEVIRIIRLGMRKTEEALEPSGLTPNETFQRAAKMLTTWCDEEEAYLTR